MKSRSALSRVPTMASQAELPPNAFDDVRPAILGCVIFCLIWSTVMVSLRVWTRAVIIKQFGVDDCFCVMGLVRCLRPSSQESRPTDNESAAGDIWNGHRHRAHDGLRLGDTHFGYESHQQPLYLRVSPRLPRPPLIPRSHLDRTSSFPSWSTAAPCSFSR